MLTDKTSDDRLLFDAMADEDDYYNRMKNIGSVAGTGLDLFGQQMDYQAFAMEANRRAAAARDRKKRGEAIIAKAGAGAEERLEAARGAKMAAAQSTLQRAADKAAMDPTGVGAIELTQKTTDTVKASGDTGEEQTYEMERMLREQELGLQETYAAKQDELAAQTAKDARRLERIKEGVFSAGKLAASFAPKDFERSQADKARRGQKKFIKQGQKHIDLTARSEQARLAGNEAKADRLAKRAGSYDYETDTFSGALGRAQKGHQKKEKHLAKLKKIQAEKAEKQQALYGNPMAATFTPGTLDPNA
jgi:hypothetical protein